MDWYTVDEQLHAGPHPALHLGLAEALEAVDVSLVVDLTQEGRAAGRHAPAPPGARRSWHPVRDFAAPTAEQMTEVLDVIDRERSAGGSVYVHCYAGVGRTGTVVGCWLVRHGWTPGAALALIRERRRDLPSYAARPDSPETPEQHALVHAWSEEP